MILVLSFRHSAIADGFRNPPPGAAGLSRANAYAAHAEGPVAVSYNPANLAASHDWSAEIALGWARSKNRLESVLGFSAETDDEWIALPNLYAGGPIADRWALGFGLTTPYGQSVDWGAIGPVARISPYRAEMAFVQFDSAVGWRVLDTVDLGVGLALAGSSLEFRQVVPWDVVLRRPGLRPGEARVETSGGGVGAQAGATWVFLPGHRLAVGARTPMTVEYDGDLKLRYAPDLPALRNSDFETEITFPARVVLGYGVEIGASVRLEADVEWVGWSSVDELPLEAGPNQALIGANPLRYDWSDTWTFNSGAEWEFAEGWCLRAGYSYVPTPVPDHTLSPTLPDEDRHVVAVGVGARWGRHELGAGWAWSVVQERHVAGNQNPAYDGVYEIEPHLWTISYRYGFR
ncbi:MAG: outer membrane protein transport protein [Kiritimatiellae bacterium]|nr:outer membrane protein transport protein [Kiritimatiellia bacterium]